MVDVNSHYFPRRTALSETRWTKNFAKVATSHRQPRLYNQPLRPPLHRHISKQRTRQNTTTRESILHIGMYSTPTIAATIGSFRDRNSQYLVEEFWVRDDRSMGGWETQQLRVRTVPCVLARKRRAVRTCSKTNKSHAHLTQIICEKYVGCCPTNQCGCM